MPDPVEKMSAGFTPGPWEVHDSDPTELIRVRAYPESDGESLWRPTIAMIDDNSDMEANAHLIAAAPEGFDLIEQLEESFTADGTYQQFLPAMRAYLAKARGHAQIKGDGNV